jgi:very-short-patch-repair endonuclease
VLSNAVGIRLSAKRREFADRDRRKLETDRGIVRGSLIGKKPPIGSRVGPKKKWTDMELLSNEFGKEKRFTPVRELMTRASSAIRCMKPCFMMSPLSLAKFLPPRPMCFDLLVIDEASQMRPEDALGGLLRAQQEVIVGDQKQLPPTDFFSRSDEIQSATGDDEDFEDIDDESILEACKKTFRQVRMLRWHYRSRCESLIAFSNKEFYGNDLITFPTARPNSFSVDLVRIGGNYEARRNPAEAQRIAEEAIRFMRRFADVDQESIPTLGLVAINREQRDLIFEELRRLEAGDLLVERYREKVADKGEPLFVKNLENVQGDERDFIFISMTYGPKPGKKEVLQRFGPINGKQGYRRLNVLFTRARIRVVLFTSMTPDDIKPIQTSSEGVHVLKRYLEYAEGKGKAAIDGVGDQPDSDFEAEVADRLRLRGFHVEMQVGVSGFKVDLGVRHPDHLERFIAGIECDGAAYHSSKSARDRDRLREEILRGLGWEILRVWSTDWFDNPDLQTERLVRQIEELRSRRAPPYQDYAIDPAYEPAAGEPIDKIAAREVPAGATNGDGSDNLVVDTTRIGESLDVPSSTASVSARSGLLSEAEVF